MKIIVGLGCDSRPPNKPPAQLGSLLCGEQGLIAALEFRVGLNTPTQSSAARTVAYLSALKAADNQARFYSESLSVDPVASAEVLLKWRDWAIFHGWIYDGHSVSNGRMADLEAAEQLFTSKGYSTGERIYALLPKITNASSSIEVIELLHARLSWPPIFQYLFDQLEKVGMQVIETPLAIEPQAPSNTDLGKLQRAVFTETNASIAFQYDGTVRLFSTDSSQLAAEYAIREANTETLIISRNHHHCLDTAIGRLQGNSSGIGDASSSRAPNQLLHLVLNCAWHTPSADVVLQYLTLNAGKFQRLRRLIARQFRDLSGYDRNNWEQIIESFVANELASQPGLDEKELRRSIDEWLPICSSDSDEAMPITLAVTLSDRVAKYWQAKLTVSDLEAAKEVFSGAYSAADAVGTALRQWPEEEISKIQLNRLLTMVIGIGNSRFRAVREVSSFDVVSCAEVVPLRSNPINHTIWIDPSIGGNGYFPPLSSDELAGIPLAPDSTQQTLFSQSALSRSYDPILSANHSLTLITIDSAPELLRLQLAALIGENAWVPLEASILKDQTKYVVTEPITDLSLPQKTRWWSIDSPVPAPRKTESFSSMASMALKPHEYALRYSAQIREGTADSLKADTRLFGNLAHQIIDSWIKENPWTGIEIEQNTIGDWLDKKLPILMRQIALPLAQPGLQLERVQFQQQMLIAMHALFKAITSANATSLNSEIRLEHDDNFGQLVGTIDIFCELQDSRFAIIDMKWGGYNKYKEELKAGRPLQLATYAHIAKGKRLGQLAAAGYFILGRAELLCNNNLIFPTATVVESDEPTSLDLTWEKFEKTLLWRTDQLKSGDVELTYCGIASDADSEPPPNSLNVIEIEASELKKRSNTYLATYKAVDVWRNLTGNIKEH